jgi:hypothetical protein
MKLFMGVFAGMAIWGFSVGANGGALIAVAMIGLVYYAQRMYTQQDQDYNNSPCSARKAPATLDLLDAEGCECSAPVFHRQISRSELEN